MREQFPHKRPGEAINAELINRLGKGARRALSVTPGQYESQVALSGSGAGTIGQPPFVQSPLVVLDDGVQGAYTVRRRVWNGSAWSTDETTGPYTLDASDSGQTFTAGQVVAGYWHPVRGAFLPVGGGGSASPVQTTPGDAYADFLLGIATFNAGSGSASSGIGSAAPLLPLVWFGIEVTRVPAEGWGVANGLVSYVPIAWTGSKTFPSEQYFGVASGVTLHSFLAQSGVTYVRVAVNASGPPDTTIWVNQAGINVTDPKGILRLKVQGLADDVPTKGGPLSGWHVPWSDIGALALGQQGVESAANNDAPVDPDEATQPWITVEATADGDLIAVHVPYGRDSDGNQTSLAYIVSAEAEITVVAEQTDGESSQSGSASSQSSLSTSSSSRSSSSSSSKSLSSQSSASSVSSASSASSLSSSSSSSSSSFSTSSSSLSSRSSISTSSSSGTSSQSDGAPI